MGFERQWSDEAVLDVVNRHVRGESNVSIGAAYGCANSTVSRLLRAPDIMRLVIAARAGLDHAAVERESAAAAAIANEKRLAADRERKRGERAKQRAESVNPARVEAVAATELAGRTRTRRKRGTSRDPGGINFREGGGLGNETEQEWRDARRNVSFEPFPVRVESPGGSCGLKMTSDDPFDREDIAARTDEIAAECGLPRSVVADRLEAARPGELVVFAPVVPADAQASLSQLADRARLHGQGATTGEPTAPALLHAALPVHEPD